MKKFYLKSMGCKSNQFEGQIVSQSLVEAGYQEVKKLDDAELFILNSCSVTHKSDNEAMYYLRQAHGKGIKTILTGCVAQIEKEKLLQEPFIDAVYGNEDKFNIVELLKNEEVFAVLDLMNKKVENGIKRHMFPLNFIPPLYLESWIICLVDKYCSFEVFKTPKNLYKYIGLRKKGEKNE